MSYDIAAKIAWICGDKPNSLEIEFNPHWTVYRTIRQEEEPPFEIDWVSPEERALAMFFGHFWNVRYYPDTPVGHFECAAFSLPAALDGMIKCLDEHRKDGQ